MTVRVRLVATFAVVTGLLAIPALFAAARLQDLEDMAVEERQGHAAASLTVGRMAATVAELKRLERTYVATPEEAHRRGVDSTLVRLDDQLDVLRRSRYRDVASLVEPTLRELEGTSDRIEDLVAGGQLLAATEALGEMEPAFVEMDAGLGTLADSLDAIARRDFARAEAITSEALDFTLLATGAALLLAVLIGGWTTRVLTGPLRDLVEATSDVSEGTFEAPRDLPYERDDEIGELSRAFRAMTWRLAELDRLKAEFLGVASHELKNPIHVIRGYTEIIEENIAGEITPRQREIMQAIGEQTRIMTRLIGRLMDISRLETGTYQLEVGPVRVADLVASLARSFGVVARDKDIAIGTEVEPSAPEVIEVDVDLLRDEVLGNLVSNAVKHTPDGSRVSIRVRGDGENAVFEVSDTGPGIPAEDRDQIFEKYYQVERSRKVGSGLGLAVAKEMVEAHGGTIELVPGAGPGATFRVTVPVRREDGAGGDRGEGGARPLEVGAGADGGD